MVDFFYFCSTYNRIQFRSPVLYVHGTEYAYSLYTLKSKRCRLCTIYCRICNRWL